MPPDDSAGTPEAADDPGADRPRAVEDVVAAVLTGSETPEVICDLLVTPELRAGRLRRRARAAVAAQQPGSLAEVGRGHRRAGAPAATATAVAVPAGGPYDGVDVEVELVAGAPTSRAPG